MRDSGRRFEKSHVSYSLNSLKGIVQVSIIEVSS